MKKSLMLISGLLFAITSFAQETSSVQKSFGEDPFNHPMLHVYVTSAFGLIVLLLIVFVGLYSFRVVKFLRTQITKVDHHKGRSNKDFLTLPIMFQKLKFSVYTSIGLILITFVFGFAKMVPLTGSKNATKAIEVKAEPEKAAIEENLEFNNDKDLIEKGKVVFQNNSCGSCHKNDGGGNAIGPNLTDEYWLHGGETKSIYATIKNGVPDKGMPAWGKTMTGENVRNVTFYVISLQGTNPPDAKAPQGDKVKISVDKKAP
ncbi:MAG TPA: c-type cytochrome [Chryseolinea sp.]